MTKAIKPSDLSVASQDMLRLMLNKFEQMATANSQAHGFWDGFDEMHAQLETEPAALQQYLIDISLSKIALMMSELGEMVEGVRKPQASDHIPPFTLEEEEMADVFIRLCDYAGKFSLRFAEAVIAKMEFNAGRPYKHGKGA